LEHRYRLFLRRRIRTERFLRPDRGDDRLFHLYYFRITANGSSDSQSGSLTTSAGSGGLHAASVTPLGNGAFRYLYDWSDPDQLLDWRPTTGASLSLAPGASPTVTVAAGTSDVRAMIWKQPIAATRLEARARTAGDHINLYSNLDAGWNGGSWCPDPALGAINRTSGAMWVVNGASYAYAAAGILANIDYDFIFTASPTSMTRSCSSDGVTYSRDGSYAPATTGRVALGAYGSGTTWGSVAIEGTPLPQAPTISSVSAATDIVTTISWSTDIPADSLIEYGTDIRALTVTVTGTVSSSDLSLLHVLTVEGLEPGTHYWYRVTSRTPTGSATSLPYSLLTGGELHPDEIVFKTTGSSFEAIIDVDSGATVLWTFADGSTSSATHPFINYQSAAVRFNRLKVTPWSAIRTIDFGYDGGDGGSYLSEAYYLPQQNVTAVYGTQNAAPSLRAWASSNNPLLALDFHDFVSLEAMEAFLCQSVRTVDLRNTPALRRLCLEDNDLVALDLSGCPNLEDLRGAQNAYTSITWGATGAHVWHICVRDNPQLTQNHPAISKFPMLTELFIWNDNQDGVLEMTGTGNPAIASLAAAGNHYTSANLAGIFPVGRSGAIDLSNNALISLNISGNPGLRDLSISGNPGLLSLNASGDQMNAAAVDDLLALIDGYGRSGGTLNLSGNAAPTADSAMHITNLQNRGWTLTLSP
jgi:Leucine-rich repeat (LRR) protein